MIGILALVAALPPALAAVDRSGSVADDLEVTAAAEAWLALIDAGEYEASWAEAGEAFKQALTAEVWAQQAAAARRQVGDPVSREVAEIEHRTDPAGAPPGRYAHLRYRSEFTNVGAASELVVLAHEAERGWRVVGYFVQPPSGE